MQLSDYEAISLYFKIAQIVSSRSKARQKNMSYHTGQYRCLYYLSEVGSIGQNELSSALNIRSTSLSEILYKLNEKGFVSRKSSPENRRTFTVSITPEGIDEIHRISETVHKDSTEFFSALSDEEKEKFVLCLGKIYDSLFKDEA